MTDDDLQRRFDDLDDLAVPPWRERTEERLGDPSGAAAAGGRRPRWPTIAAAAIAALALVVTAVVVWPDDEDDAVVAGPADEDVPQPPVPLDDRKLVCPPVLLDVSGLAADPVLAPGYDAGSDGPSTYALTWQQDGVDVTLSYPGPFVRTLDLPPNETVTLADGRSAYLQFGADTTIDVPVSDGDYCSSFWVSVPGDGRDAAVAIAEQVFVRAPAGTSVVPDVVGLDGVDAQDALARAGLVPEPVELFPQEPVATQSPPPGTEVPIGSDVTLTYGPPPTTTAPPTQELSGASLPVPDEPIICPYARIEVDDVVTSAPRVAFGTTLEWEQPGGYLVRLQWPGPDVANGNFRDLTIDGRRGRIYDGGDGQNLVYDTGLADGPCRFIELSVYGGPSIPERERRAEALATDGIGFPPIPDVAPPDVVGMNVAEAADTLARAGFIPDWGARPTLPGEGDLPLGGPEAPTDEVVRSQRDGGDFVVVLTTG